MAHGQPRDHHYVPQFYLREFACDPERKKIRTVSRNDRFAVFAERSIKSLGFERDLYVHWHRGVPVNVESVINTSVETPLSTSEAWKKISAGQSEHPDRADKGVIYSLIRHLNSRSIHTRQITKELARMAADPDSAIPFTDAERSMYSKLRRSPSYAQAFSNFSAASIPWSERDFHASGLSILRSPIALRSSTVPVMILTATAHPALHLPLPGQQPYTFVLALNRTTLAMLALGDFDGAFSNVEMTPELAKSFNRHNVGYFRTYSHVRHVIGDEDQLVEDMTWAGYELLYRNAGHIKFRQLDDDQERSGDS